MKYLLFSIKGGLGNIFILKHGFSRYSFNSSKNESITISLI